MRLALLAVAVVVSSSCSDASLSEMRPGLSSGGFQCWLTLKLKSLPKGDVNDLHVVFSSIVLFHDEDFDWEYITTHDHQVVANKDWMGNEQHNYVLDAATTPEDTPTPGMELKVLFQLPSQKQVEVHAGDDTNLNAALFWGNERQDTMARGMFLAYQKQ